jgi:hypothetical protein
VEDAEQRRDGAIDPALLSLEAGAPRLVDGDAQPSRAGGLANDLRRRCFRSASVVCDHERPDRLSKLPEAGHVGR